MGDERIFSIYVSGVLPTKSLWERIKQVFNGEPDSFTCVIDIDVGEGDYMWISRVREMQGLATLDSQISVVDPDVWHIIREKWEKERNQKVKERAEKR
jgi:hypothetical protein